LLGMRWTSVWSENVLTARVGTLLEASWLGGKGFGACLMAVYLKSASSEECPMDVGTPSDVL
jgi:hypothetical protein